MEEEEVEEIFIQENLDFIQILCDFIKILP